MDTRASSGGSFAARTRSPPQEGNPCIERRSPWQHSCARFPSMPPAQPDRRPRKPQLCLLGSPHRCERLSDTTFSARGAGQRASIFFLFWHRRRELDEPEPPAHPTSRRGRLFSSRAGKCERGERADDGPLHRSECSLDHEIVRNRGHHVLGGDGDGSEAPRQDRAERGVDETSREQRSAARRKSLQVDPSEESRLDQHGEKAERKDDVLSIDGERLVITSEQDQVPDEPERERRREIGENPKSKTPHHHRHPFPWAGSPSASIILASWSSAPRQPSSWRAAAPPPRRFSRPRS